MEFWEKEYIQADGRALIALLSVFFRRKLPSLKETRSSNSVFATVLLVCRPAGYTAGTYASSVAILPTNLTIRHITCLCYGIPTIHKPRSETLDLCSSEHSKVCFQPLKMN